MRNRWPARAEARPLRAAPLLAALVLAGLLPGAARPAEAQAPGRTQENAPAPGIFDPEESWEHPGQVRLEPDELRFVERKARTFRSETVYFTGLLNDGWTFTISFSAWNYSVFSGWGVFAVLADPDGTGHWFQKEVRKSAVRVGTEGLSIRFDEGSIEGSPPEYRIRLRDIQGLTCDLRVRSRLGPWKPGNGYAWLSGERDVYTHFRVPVPWGEVRGTLELPGERLDVEGECYGDQSTLVAPPSRLSSPVCALRAFSPPGTPAGEHWFLGLYEAISHPEYGGRRQPMLLLADTSGWRLTTRRFTLRPSDFLKSDAAPYEFPTRYRLSVEDQGYRLEGEYTLDSVYNVTDILRSLPPFLRGIADALIKRPVIFRGVGGFEGELTEPGGAVRPIRLEGPIEYMIIR